MAKTRFLSSALRNCRLRPNRLQNLPTPRHNQPSMRKPRLILPRLTGILPVLTTWAALGLATIMLLAAGFHLSRGEISHAVITIVLLALAAFVVYGRGFKGPVGQPN